MIEFFLFVVFVLAVAALLLASLAYSRIRAFERRTKPIPTVPQAGYMTCPFCRGSIRQEAAKCRHCGAFLRPVSAKEVEILEPETVAADPIPPPPAQPVPPEATSRPAEPLDQPSGGLERVVGERVLSGLGILVVVVGVALLLWYSYTKLGAGGKVLLAGATGVGLIVLGAFLERRPRFRIPGGCMVGGGWAIAYATAYASYHLETARIISSPGVAMALLLVVGAGALLHALRYRKEWIAGLAYALLFVTFLLFRLQPAVLPALAPLAISLAILAWRLRWIRLGLAGLVALYVIVGYAATESAGRTGIALGALWILMSITALLYRAEKGEDIAVHALFSLANGMGLVAVGLITLSRFSIPHHWWLFALASLAYALKSQPARRLRRSGPYAVHLLAASFFLAWAAHLRLSVPWIAVSWMVLGCALLAYGLLRREAWPRFLGHLLVVAGLIRTWTLDRHDPGNLALGRWTVELIAIPAFMGALFLFLHAAALAKLKFQDRLAPVWLSYLGAGTLALALGTYPPPIAVGALYGLVGLLLVEIGRGVRSASLRIQGASLALLAAAFVIAVNLGATDTIKGISRRLVATIPILGVWCYLAPRINLPGVANTIVRGGLEWSFFLGTMTLLRFELGAVATPFAWCVLAAVWIGWGSIVRRGDPLLQGALAACGAVILYAAESHPEIPFAGKGGPLPVGIFMAAILLGLHPWLRTGPATWQQIPSALRRLSREFLTLALAVCLFLLLSRSVRGTWLTGSWALLGVGLSLYGFALQDRTCRWLSLAVLALCLVKLFAFDFPAFTMPVKIATTIAVGACMVAISLLYARYRGVLTAYLTRD